MSYLGVLEAVRSRLEGRGPYHVPKLPDLPRTLAASAPERLIGVQKDAVVDAFLRRDVFTEIGAFNVPIHYFDMSGHTYELAYPSFAFEIVDYSPRYEEYLFDDGAYGAEAYSIPVSGSTATVLDNGEDIGMYPRMVKKRAIEQPVNILFEVRAYSKDPIQSALMVNYVYSIFPPRYFMRVPMQDGSYRSWDAFFENFQDLDRREAVRSAQPGIIREYAKVWTYRVEGYFDNTDTAIFSNLVQKRNINVSGLG